MRVWQCVLGACERVSPPVIALLFGTLSRDWDIIREPPAAEHTTFRVIGAVEHVARQLIPRRRIDLARVSARLLAIQRIASR